MEIRIRLGSGIARFAPAPLLRLDLPDGATVDDLYERLAAGHPELAPALGSALPVLRGRHVGRRQSLAEGDEIALLAPVAGGSTCALYAPTSHPLHTPTDTEPPSSHNPG